MTDLSRRRLLAVTGTACTGAVAGCMGSDGTEGNGDGRSDSEADGNDGSTTTDPDGTRLGDITVDNLDDAAHTIDVIVEFDGTIDVWATKNLAAGGGATLERDWPSGRQQFRVIVRRDQGEPVEVTPADWNEPSCLNLFVRVDRNGELTVLSNTSSGPCSADDASGGGTDA
ncbi:MAG TPA: hypothetical protein VKM69_09365 [Natronoarchaeum rubrum]|nr:hypothetical protein [Natronoarchaeum rubrum]